MKLETIRNRPYYLKTGPSELVEFRLEYVDKFRDVDEDGNLIENDSDDEIGDID